MKINEGTQTDIYIKTNAGTAVQVVKLDVGSGTALADWGGTVTSNVNSGTINVGTVAISNSPVVTVSAGSLVGTVVANVNTGTINVGTVAVSNTPNVAVTSLPSGGTILNLATGTLASLPAVSLTSSGTILNLATGTIASLPAVSLNSSGTILNLATGTLANSGTTTGVGTVTNVGSLTNAGTIKEISNIAGGTINVPGVSSGTNNNIVTGTLNTGTFTPVALGTSYGTQGTTGAGVWGTLIAASGAGTKQYVSGVDISVVSGTVEVAVTNIGVGGSTGAGVLARGNFPAGGGISKNFNPIQASGTNGTLAFWMGGAGTVDVTIQYWQA